MNLVFSVFNTVLKRYSTQLVRATNVNYSHARKCIYPTISKSNYSTKSNADVSFEEMKNLTTKSDTLLIDVREATELQETGAIPGTINIPLGEVETVFTNKSSDEFLKTFGRSKPTIDSPIVFSCLLGKRSAMAQSITQQLGFKNVRNYIGGWSEWSERSKQ